MSQAPTILRTHEGHIWYSEEYIREQIQNAYMSGIAAGATIKFHAVAPNRESEVQEYAKQFYELVEGKYQYYKSKGKVVKP